jgi:hypothetical protein
MHATPTTGDTGYPPALTQSSAANAAYPAMEGQAVPQGTAPGHVGLPATGEPVLGTPAAYYPAMPGAGAPAVQTGPPAPDASAEPAMLIYGAKSAAHVAPANYQDGELHDATKSASDRGFTDQNGDANESGTRGYHSSGFFHRLKRFIGREIMRKMLGCICGKRHGRHGHHGHGYMGGYNYGGGYGGHGHGYGSHICFCLFLRSTCFLLSYRI